MNKAPTKKCVNFTGPFAEDVPFEILLKLDRESGIYIAFLK